jgi:hypothetical protein
MGVSDTKNMSRPTGSMLVVFVLFCLCLIGQSAAMQPNTADPLNKIKEFNSNFIHHVYPSELSLVQPKLTGKDIFCSKDARQESGLKNFLSNYLSYFAPIEEDIVINCSHPDQQVQNIFAFNSNKQRNIVFDDMQRGELKDNGLENFLDTKVQGNGKGQSRADRWLDLSSDVMGFEDLADNAVNSSQHDRNEGSSASSGKRRLGNYMNIEVSGISVQAVNTVEGGSAVATSNIEIKPVQIINCPPEVEEKLK